MKKSIVVFALLSVFLSSCGDTGKNETAAKSEVEKVYTEESMQGEITELEKEEMAAKPEMKAPLRERLIGFYLSYADLFPEDSLAPEMIFKAGNQAVNGEEFKKAIGYYQRVVDNYPGYLKRPEAMYMIGFVYDAHLNEKGNAKMAWEKLIAAYPDHILSEQAQQSIEVLGMSDEELIRKFEQQNNDEE